MDKEAIIYSVGVLSYNKENLISDTLKSIEYQMKRYGNDKKVQLIIADDGSKDDSIRVISEWLERNRSLFWEVITLFSQSNHGTAYVYSEIIKAIKGDCYFIMAADDLLPCNSVFPILEMQLQRGVDYVVPFTYSFTGNRIGNGVKDNRTVLLQMLIHDKNRHVMLFENLHAYAPVALRLFTDDLLEYVGEFDLLEDASRWHFLRKKYARLHGITCKAPIALYRKSPESVSGGNPTTLARYEKDVKKLEDDRESFYGRKYKALFFGRRNGWKRFLCLDSVLRAILYRANQKNSLQLLNEINGSYFEANQEYLAAICRGESVETLMKGSEV